MAVLWSRVREEFQGVVDDFRQKGAAGALYDAALDVRDLAKDAGDVLIGGAKALVSNDDAENLPYAQVDGPPAVETLIEVHYLGGQPSIMAEVVAVDTISQPPRARVRVADDSTCILVQLLPPGSKPRSGNEGKSPDASETAGDADVEGAQMTPDNLKGAVTNVLTGLSNEFKETVQDFKEKGAATALKDVALDAVDLVGAAAETVASYSARGAQKATQLANKTVTMLNSPPKTADPDDWLRSDTDAAQGTAEAKPSESSSPTADARPSSSSSAGNAKPGLKLNMPAKESDPEEFIIGTARRRESLGCRPNTSTGSAAASTCEEEEEELID